MFKILSILHFSLNRVRNKVSVWTIATLVTGILVAPGMGIASAASPTVAGGGTYSYAAGGSAI